MKLLHHIFLVWYCMNLLYSSIYMLWRLCRCRKMHLSLALADTAAIAPLPFVPVPISHTAGNLCKCHPSQQRTSSVLGHSWHLVLLEEPCSTDASGTGGNTALQWGDPPCTALCKTLGKVHAVLQRRREILKGKIISEVNLNPMSDNSMGEQQTSVTGVLAYYPLFWNISAVSHVVHPLGSQEEEQNHS